MARLTIADKLASFASLEDALANCPERESHAEGRPTGYFEYFEWAERMKKTHRQLRCDGCGRYLVLVPK